MRDTNDTDGTGAFEDAFTFMQICYGVKPQFIFLDTCKAWRLSIRFSSIIMT